MRKIASLQEENKIELFSNYLKSINIQNTIRKTDNLWVLWTDDENSISKAKEAFAAFTNDPTNKKYMNIPKVKIKKKKIIKRATIVLGPAQPHGTIALIIICLIVAMISGVGEHLKPIRLLFLFNPLQSGHYWTLITPIFIHFSIMHLVFNMLAFYTLGLMVEGKHGSIFYLTQIIVIATISNVTQLIAVGGLFGGMSGVVFGLFGYLWIRERIDPKWDVSLSESSVKLIFAWFFLCWFNIFPNVANHAHTAGLLYGILWGFIAVKFKKI